MIIKRTISKEDIAKLTKVDFAGKIHVVETPQDAERAATYLKQFSLLGIDTETRPSFKAGVTNKVALLQLSTYERCYLIRLCRVKFSNKLQSILQRSDIVKVGADVAGDLRSLSKVRSFTPRGFLDLQSEVGKFGIEDKSLRKMSGIILGKRVSKAQRLSNWEAQSFTDQQKVYAATDAWVCLKILERLKAEAAHK